GAGAAGPLVRAAHGGEIDDRGSGIRKPVREPRAEGVEGGLDAGDRAVRVVDARRRAEVVKPGDELGGVGAEGGEVGKAVAKRADRLPEGALGDVLSGGVGLVAGGVLAAVG